MIHVCIIGLGLIGGSLGMALRRVRWKGRRVFTVHGGGRSAAQLRRAKRRGAADHVSTKLSEVVSPSDIIVLAAPVQVIPALAKKILPWLKTGALLTDVGSVKSAIQSDILKVLKKRNDVEFVGAHPLAGSEKSGIENASHKIFDPSFCVITTDRADKKAVQRVASLWKSVGAHPLFLSSSQHDQTLALTSHLPHLLSFSLFSQVNKASGRNKNIPRLVAGSFRDMTRIAGSDADVWTGILSSNRYELKKTWKFFQSEVNRFLSSRPSSLQKTLSHLSSAKRRWKQS